MMTPVLVATSLFDALIDVCTTRTPRPSQNYWRLRGQRNSVIVSHAYRRAAPTICVALLFPTRQQVIPKYVRVRRTGMAFAHRVVYWNLPNAAQFI